MFEWSLELDYSFAAFVWGGGFDTPAARSSRQALNHRAVLAGRHPPKSSRGGTATEAMVRELPRVDN
jgi:hypothetical protein